MDRSKVSVILLLIVLPLGFLPGGSTSADFGQLEADTVASVDIIWQVLLTLYAGDIVDIDRSTDLVQSLPAIIDRALKGSSCPFNTYRDSLLSFANAIYALRLDRGRCVEPGFPRDCGFYDPENLYHNPAVSTIIHRGEQMTYSGAHQEHPAGIPSSFGIDLIEVELDPAADDQPLAIQVRGRRGSPPHTT